MEEWFTDTNQPINRAILRAADIAQLEGTSKEPLVQSFGIQDLEVFRDWAISMIVWLDETMRFYTATITEGNGDTGYLMAIMDLMLMMMMVGRETERNVEK